MVNSFMPWTHIKLSLRVLHFCPRDHLLAHRLGHTTRPVWSPPGPRTTFPRAPPGVHDFPHPPRFLPACTACASVVSPVLPVAPKIAIFLTVMLQGPGPEKLRTRRTRGNPVATRWRAAGPPQRRRRGRGQTRFPPGPRPLIWVQRAGPSRPRLQLGGARVGGAGVKLHFQTRFSDRRLEV